MTNFEYGLGKEKLRNVRHCSMKLPIHNCQLQDSKYLIEYEIMSPKMFSELDIDRKLNR